MEGIQWDTATDAFGIKAGEGLEGIVEQDPMSSDGGVEMAL